MSLSESSKRNQSGGAILLALIVIVVGGILLTNWIRTKPQASSGYNYLNKYQARLFAEAGLAGTPLDSLHGWTVEDSIGPNVFYTQRDVKVSRGEMSLGILSASSLEQCDDEFWNTNLRLWTREELVGDTRRIEGRLEVKSPEDLADDLDENAMDYKWFVGLAEELKSQWDSSLVHPEFEVIKEDRIVSYDEDLSGVRWLVEGKLILEPGAKVKDAIILSEEGVELQSDSELSGRILSQGPIDLMHGAQAKGWWGILAADPKDSTYAAVTMTGASFGGSFIALNGPRTFVEDYVAFSKDPSSNFDGFLLSPYPVEVHGDLRGVAWVYALNCGSGNNCLGDAKFIEADTDEACLQAAWIQNSSESDDKQLQWTQQHWSFSK